MSTRKSKSGLSWESPPPKSTERYDWAAIAEELRKHPGEWAKIFDNDRASLATAIRIDGIKALLPENGFEVRTTNNVRGDVRMCTMYLRWVPPEQTKKGKR